MPRQDGTPTIDEILAGCLDDDEDDLILNPCPSCGREMAGTHKFQCPYSYTLTKATKTAPPAPALNMPKKPAG